MPKKPKEEKLIDPDEDLEAGVDDDEPIPARRDVRIFHREKEKKDKDDDFEEDVFV